MANNSWWSSRKWWEYQLLRKDPVLSKLTPETKRMTKATFLQMLDKYGSVVMKPIGGSLGKGVVHIERVNKSFHVHYLNRRRSFSTKAAVIRYLNQLSQGRPQLIQQRIRLGTISGSPFDIRVMVQRTPNKPWQVTGKLARAAGKGYFVTNVKRSHGKVVSYYSALNQSSLSTDLNRPALNRRINSIALRTASLMSRHRGSLMNVGLDIGLDQKGNPWIIEVNFRPMIWMFRRLSNQNMYQRILKMHRRQDKLS